jgi:hypothetical protein
MVGGSGLVPQRDFTLYGRGRIVRIVGDALKRKGVPSRPLPIILIVGPRGSGGTAVLGRLWSEYGQDSPGVQLDLAKAQTASDVVFAAMQGLRRKIPGIRAIQFSRLRLAFKALSYIDDGGGRVAFDAYMKSGNRTAAIGSLLQESADRAAPLLRSPDQQVVAAFLAPAVSGLLSGIDRHRDKKILEWFTTTNHMPGGSDGHDQLWELFSRQQEQTDDSQRQVDKTLCAALLADLRADFNTSSLLAGQRTTNCLLLFDGAGTKVGDRFLELLEECRRESEIAGESGDPVVLVAVRRGRPHRWIGEPIGANDEQLAQSWLDPARDGWWFPVRLTDLSREDTIQMTRSNVLGSTRRDADLIHALTGGHAAATRLLVSHLQQSDKSVVEVRRLLSHKVDSSGEPATARNARAVDTTLEQYLFERVFAQDLHTLPHSVGETGGAGSGSTGVAGNTGRGRTANIADSASEESMADAIAVCAATPELRLGACQGVFRYLGWTQISAVEARDLLVSTMWLDQTRPQGSADPKLHPLAELLLTGWAARDLQKWRNIHSGYVTCYSRAQDAALRQHHKLALVDLLQTADFAEIVEYLDTERGRCPAQEWLTLLDTVTSAPSRLSTTRDPRTSVTTLAGAADPGDRRRVIARLAAARWLARDRTFDPSHQLARLVANEYDNLAQLSAPDGEVFFEESAAYRRLEREWES